MRHTDLKRSTAEQRAICVTEGKEESGEREEREHEDEDAAGANSANLSAFDDAHLFMSRAKSGCESTCMTLLLANRTPL